MGPLTQKLSLKLDELLEFLVEKKESHWAEWMRKGKALIEAEDFRGIEHILKAFGGMGSFNDLMYTDQGDNDKYNELAGAVYELSIEIKKAYESNT